MMTIVEYLKLVTDQNDWHGKGVDFIKTVEKVTKRKGVKSVSVEHDGMVVLNFNEQSHNWSGIKRMSMPVGAFINLYGNDKDN